MIQTSGRQSLHVTNSSECIKVRVFVEMKLLDGVSYEQQEYTAVQCILIAGHPSQSTLGPSQPPVQEVSGSLSGGKAAGRGVAHQPHLAPRLKKT